MLCTYFDILNYAVLSIISSWFIISYFSFSNNNFLILKMLAFFTGGMAVGLLKTFGICGQMLSLALFVAFYFVISVLLLKGRIFEKFFCSCMVMVLSSIINLIVSLVFSLILGQTYIDMLSSDGVTRTCLICISAILYTAILLIFLKSNQKHHFYFSKLEHIAIIITFILTASVCMTISDILSDYNELSFRFTYIITCMIALNFIIFMSLSLNSRNRQKENEMKLLRFQLKQQEKSMLEVDKVYEEATKIRHDIKNHISCALVLAENKYYDDLKKYLGDLFGHYFSSSHNFITTESRVLNAVLNSKLSIAQNEGTAIDCVITGTLDNVEELDISILLSNLLDNAIEACRKIENPRLKFEMFNQNSYLCIRISNTCNESELLSNPSLESTKPDSENHGLGLKSVSDIVNKYKGSIKHTVKNNVFTVSIILSN